jgi:hypothetical protein
MSKHNNKINGNERREVRDEGRESGCWHTEKIRNDDASDFSSFYILMTTIQYK